MLHEIFSPLCFNRNNEKKQLHVNAMSLGFLKNYCDIESKNKNLNCQQQDRKVNVKVERTHMEGR